MTSKAHDLSLRILAGLLSIIMTLLMFLPMKAAFGASLPVANGRLQERVEARPNSFVAAVLPMCPE